MAGTVKWSVRAGWLTVFLVPPAAATVVWRSTVVHHLAIAVALVVCYEFVMVVTRFVAAVATGLMSRWQERLVDTLDLALRRRVSRFGRRYKAFVLAGLRFIDLKGLATVGPFTPELAEVFVDVSLTLQPPHLVRSGILADLPIEVTGRHSLGEFLTPAKNVVLAVIGGPGSGKTTLLRHTARQVCLREGQYRRVRRIPILLYLRDHVGTIDTEPRVTLGELVRGTLGRLSASEPNEWFEQRLHNGECVVLLDGLDEVARPEDRRAIAAWVEAQIRHYPNNDYVITSRPHGYATAGIDGADVLQVRNFTDEQVHRFVNGWYLAVERHSTGADDQDILRRASLGAEDLLLRLDHASALHDLTVNPLLLTMIANVHRYRGALPGSRAELYSEICQVMLFRRQEAKNLVADLPGDKKEVLLRRLAYVMMRQKLSDLTKEDVYKEFKPALRRLPFNVAANDFLSDIETSGLLVERESGLYSFAHHTFQEYLAAAHIRDKGLVNIIAQAVDDSWWRETILLYASGADADPVITACLESDSIIALALAFDCADQGSEFAADLRNRLDNLLGTASDPETSLERRRLIIGALLARHLTQLVRSSDGTRVCPDPITGRLYRFFLEDTNRPPPDCPRKESTENKPAFGMRASDAAAFTQWVNVTMGGSVTYRIPNPTAVCDATIQRLITAAPGEPYHRIWTMPSGEPAASGDHIAPEIWIPPGSTNPYLVDSATLTGHIRNDIAAALSIITRLLVLQSSFMIRALGHSFIFDCARDEASALSLLRTFDTSLDRTLTYALDRTLPGTRELTRIFAHSLALDKVRALVLHENFAIAVGQVPSLDPGLVRTLDLDSVGARSLRRTLDRALHLGVNADAKFALDLEHVLSHDLDLDPDLDLDETLMDLNSALGRARALDNAFGHSIITCYYPIMGRALTQGLAAVRSKPRDNKDWSNRFSKAFADAAGIAEDYVISLDGLADELDEARRMINELLVPRDRPAQPAWAPSVADRLQDTVTPMIDRRVPITGSAASSARLAVLCLAAEADALDQQELSDKFRRIAAGVTLLERRIKGDAPASEIILLASE